MIIHFDGDAFFASVEQANDYHLRGKPVVVGKERGAATSVSYEAKKYGINRGIPLREMRKLCPNLVLVDSDYGSYSVYSDRMYRIARRFTDNVEEYSIDECFADITGLDKEYGMTYEEIALAMKKALETELGITFGVGLAPNKVLAKIASKWRKPSGFTVIYPETINEFLKDLPVGKLWGVGPSMSMQFSNMNVRTALQLAEKDRRWLDAHKIAKPYREIQAELQGKLIKEIGGSREDAKSFIRSRTFSPPTKDRATLFSELSKNIEGVCDKARRHGVMPRFISFYLKTQEFNYHSYEYTLPVATASAQKIIGIVGELFDRVYRPKILYRATGIALRGLIGLEHLTHDLFGEQDKLDEVNKVNEKVDKLNGRYGAHTVFLASSLSAFNRENNIEIYKKNQSRGKRKNNEEAEKATGLLLHLHTSKHLNIPFLGKVSLGI